MKKNSVVCGLAILLMAVFAVGCVGPGALTKIPVNMSGGKATIFAHNQVAPDWMLSRDKLALNYIVKGEVSAKQLADVAEAETACRIFTKRTRPNNLVAVLSSGILYGAAGFIGVGIGSQAFIGVNSLAYGAYGAAAGFTGGVANGLITLGGQTYTFENCGSQILGLFPGSDVRVLQKSPY
jgi:hypothetical protein